MKGLIKNDLYVFGKTFAWVLPIIFVCSALIVIFSETIVFFSETDELLYSFPCMYSCVILGFVPATLYSYDKRSGWNKYNTVMPYRRRDYVSVKYLFGLVVTFLYILFISCVILIKINTSDQLDFNDYIFMLFIMVLCSLAPVAIIMPISLKRSPQAGFIIFGIEFFVIVFLIGMASGFLDAMFEENAENWYDGSQGNFIAFGGAALVSVILYVISWFRSIKIYEKAEL